MKIADTALPVAALTNEAETERMPHWLGRQPEDNLAISDWVATEFSFALYSEDRPVIDLLHIDGSHFYPDVVRDFTT